MYANLRMYTQTCIHTHTHKHMYMYILTSTYLQHISVFLFLLTILKVLSEVQYSPGLCVLIPEPHASSQVWLRSLYMDFLFQPLGEERCFLLNLEF